MNQKHVYKNKYKKNQEDFLRQYTTQNLVQKKSSAATPGMMSGGNRTSLPTTAMEGK